MRLHNVFSVINETNSMFLALSITALIFTCVGGYVLLVHYFFGNTAAVSLLAIPTIRVMYAIFKGE